MARRDIIAIGGSAGSFEALRTIAQKLPADLSAAVFVVAHLSRAKNYLPDLLDGCGELPAASGLDGERIQPGRIYVAPPDRYLLIAEDHVHLTRRPKGGLHRQSINVTFRSAALTYGPRVIGVLLSGLLDDGASGLWDIANRRGIAVVQDPEEAPFPSMPINALHDADVHYRLTAEEIGSMLPRLVGGEEIPKRKEQMPSEPRYDRFSGFTCPECHGPLYENTGPGPTDFRCRVGHVLSLKTLMDEHTSAQERKLYEAVLALEEGADLALYTTRRAGASHHQDFRNEAEQLRRHAGTIRRLLEERNAPGVD